MLASPRSLFFFFLFFFFFFFIIPRAFLRKAFQLLVINGGSSEDPAECWQPDIRVPPRHWPGNEYSVFLTVLPLLMMATGGLQQSAPAFIS